MDYEKKYKEALERARDVYDYYCDDNQQLWKIESIFPELKEDAESEDEKTRKDLIDTIHHAASSDVHISEELEQRYLAYLEKQKPVGGLSKRKVYGIMSKLSNLSQSELIPLDSKEFEVINEITTDVRSFLDYPIEQKSSISCGHENDTAWSEEDEHRRTDAIYFLESAKRHYADTREIEKAIDWLKSLRPQTRKEIYQAAKHDLAIKFMNYLDENRPEGKMSLSNGECDDIDKAFKENDWAKIMRYIEKYSSHWKPSEEQMKALYDMVCGCRPDDHQLLQDLYFGLNKL